jgi:PPK2 family polyphosphate:nucleotide phosphotransferase
MINDYKIDSLNSFKLKNHKTDDNHLCEDKEKALKLTKKNIDKIYEYQQKLYAEKKEGLIIAFQAMDAAGKDGTIREVLKVLAPQGVYEKPFKAPSSTELAHDYLWRVHKAVPEKGEISIFNRSHYEDVLIAKVKKLYKSQNKADRINEDIIIENRYEDIRNFEKYLYNNSVRIIKIFLNVSKKEQAERFLSRIEEPEKNWKFSDSDFEERVYWDDYQQAFEDAINATSTEECPWYVVPADRKWYMRYVVSEIVVKTLEEMNPNYPIVTKEILERFEGYRTKLLEEYNYDLDSIRINKKNQ